MRQIMIAIGLLAAICVGALVATSNDQTSTRNETPVRLAGCINGVCS